MSSTEVPSGAKRPRWTAEYKADAVAMVIDGGRSIIDVARSLGLVEQTLGNWVRQARIDRGDKHGITSDERAELVRLRRENAHLTMERDLLKRATAF
jgi:transposase